MSAHLLISGRLFKKPETRRSKNGRDFATAAIVERVAAGEGETGSRFWKVIAFDAAAIAELSRLDEGDACSAAGAFSAELYEDRNGEKKLALKVIADRVMGLRPVPKKRERRGASPGDVRETVVRSWQAPLPADDGRGPNDDLPF